MNTQRLLAQATPDPTLGALFGTVAPPPGLPAGSPLDILIRLLNLALNMTVIVAGLFALVNFLISGYTYITSGGDVKKTTEANLRMTYTVIGVFIVIVAPVLAGIIGLIAFGNWRAILQPEIVTIGP